jgi:flagellar biosynthetic protein FliS
MDAAESARRYAVAQVTAVDRRGLLLLVLEAGERFLRLTRDALRAGDLPRFATHLGRAQAVIAELRGTLDPAAGPLAADLGRLYEFMLFHLTAANAERSLRHVDEVRSVFDTIAGAYRAVLAPPA